MQVFQVEAGSVIDFAPNGQTLVTGDPVTVVDMTDGTQQQILATGSRSFGFIRGGAAIACLHPDCRLTVYDLLTRQHRTIECASARTIKPVLRARGFVDELRPRSSALAVSADRRTIYLGVCWKEIGGLFRSESSNGRSEVMEFDADTLTCRGVFGHFSGHISEMTVSANGRFLVGGDVQQNEVRIWDVTDGRHPNRAKKRLSLKDRLWALDVAPDGSHVVTTSYRGVTICDTRTGKSVYHADEHKQGIPAVACGPAQPVFVTGNQAGGVRLWDYTGRALAHFEWGLGEVRGLAFSPDGLRCAAVDSKGKVVVWDVDL